jgi:hypothetical protein
VPCEEGRKVPQAELDVQVDFRLHASSDSGQATRWAPKQKNNADGKNPSALRIAEKLTNPSRMQAGCIRLEAPRKLKLVGN